MHFISITHRQLDNLHICMKNSDPDPKDYEDERISFKHSNTEHSKIQIQRYLLLLCFSSTYKINASQKEKQITLIHDSRYISTCLHPSSPSWTWMLVSASKAAMGGVTYQMSVVASQITLNCPGDADAKLLSSTKKPSMLNIKDQLCVLSTLNFRRHLLS